MWIENKWEENGILKRSNDIDLTTLGWDWLKVDGSKSKKCNLIVRRKRGVDHENNFKTSI